MHLLSHSHRQAHKHRHRRPHAIRAKFQAKNLTTISTQFQVWINQGDIILVGLRDYQDSKADVILKYTPDEARNLKTYGEFPESVRINDTVTFVEDGFDEDIEFGDEISSEDEADSVDNI